MIKQKESNKQNQHLCLTGWGLYVVYNALCINMLYIVHCVQLSLCTQTGPSKRLLYNTYMITTIDQCTLDSGGERWSGMVSFTYTYSQSLGLFFLLKTYWYTNTTFRETTREHNVR